MRSLTLSNVSLVRLSDGEAPVRYVLRKVAQDGRGGIVALPPDAEPLYLYKSVRRDRHGFLRYMVTPDVDKARTWATRAGVEKYLDMNLTYALSQGRVSLFAVEELEA